MRGFKEKNRRSLKTRWQARKLAAVATVLTALSLGSACAFIPHTPQTVSLRVQGNVPDANVTIDDIPLGALAYVAAHGVALPPGKHRVTVERVGYFPWDAVVEAQDDPINLQVKLVPIPD
jgi:hypothetical protein